LSWPSRASTGITRLDRSKLLGLAEPARARHRFGVKNVHIPGDRSEALEELARGGEQEVLARLEQLGRVAPDA
jgi:hypothetical protein